MDIGKLKLLAKAARRKINIDVVSGNSSGKKRKYKKVSDTCLVAGVPVPEEVTDFFVSCESASSTIVIGKLADTSEPCADGLPTDGLCKPWNEGRYYGYDIIMGRFKVIFPGDVNLRIYRQKEDASDSCLMVSGMVQDEEIWRMYKDVLKACESAQVETPVAVKNYMETAFSKYEAASEEREVNLTHSYVCRNWESANEIGYEIDVNDLITELGNIKALRIFQY